MLKLSRLRKGANSKVSTEPKLPPELEKIIFSYAYQNDPKDIKNLLQVARRVEEWLCPSIFKVTILLRTLRFPLRSFTLSTIRRYGRYINHLALNVSLLKPVHDEGLIDILFDFRSKAVRQLFYKVVAACPNLINLWVDSNELVHAKNFFPGFSRLITHLSVRLRLLLRQLETTKKSRYRSKPLDPSAALFPCITHLYAFGYPFDDNKEDIQSSLLSIHFPNLTHLGLAGWHADRQRDGTNMVLKRCKRLELVVLVRATAYRGSSPLWQGSDGRVVEIFCAPLDPWMAGARGDGPDVWEIAERHRSVQLQVSK